ncbi:excinuclease ABC subunit UvrA [Bifidobacterium mongoliense]|uniref:UvrABC system protein A n=1 Tax=Bifidobacterium mongoliense DSM 21395 TaxID=1437603 RepID=A0A087C0Q3_9BIFI|nr:excinuclease ABC subunit UvrA [Bifidobacterium mongoliense]KFI76853.1 excinuclease ABC subunit A [Bifidobacterium mongoliense DSM 21395]MDN5979369.1 excinuclease ABC subunit UvrA [Bifidobacterium mongoliense]MDN6025837.1 excinuclease ABC subunit UvrA [Bifidobacterium mongoliense]MDN6051761.1 excinuclease ABC subunit UvrA [Bifidobacterium mongoliense]MDN6719710.1 excinuclease ABC subunit UvrA [Bifidobacterium mongoliense]
MDVQERREEGESLIAGLIERAPLVGENGSLIADISKVPNDMKITVQGAREHNLKNVDLQIPRNRMVVFTGLSGSGKSSLAFDTLFAEGQRRYVESLSAYARQFLGRMDKPDVDFIEGLSPAVSIDQKTTNRNPRSTVGTITEIYDYLRLLFARTGIPHCPVCGEPVSSQTPQQMVDSLLHLAERTRFQVLAPVVRGRKGEFQDLLELLRSDGYARALIDGEMRQLSDDITLTKQKKHTIEVVVDRLVIKDGVRQRLTDSIETALKLAKGRIVVDFVDLDEHDPKRRRPFSERRACPNGHELEIDEIEPRTFSFNAPYGACPECTGIGYKLEIDPELVIPDPDKSLADGAIEPWGMTKTSGEYYRHVLEGLAEDMGFDMATPWRKLPEATRHAIMYGHDFKVKVSYRNRWGRLREYSTGFEGVVRTLMRRHDETDSEQMKQYYESYMREVPCQSCHGRRLKPEVLAVTVGDRSIAEVSEMPVQRSLQWATDLHLDGAAAKIAGEVLKEIRSRLGFLNDVGLNYLTLARAAKTLSGGEAQRIRLATQIGSGLVGVMYVLDEPSIGLHQRDNERLIATLHHLRDLGNTLIVVEHDEETIERADWLVDIGPGAGEHGGEVVYSGPARHLVEASRSITGDYIARRRRIEVPEHRRRVRKTKQLKVVGARENNLKDIDVNFPLGVMTCVTGVSGSGKSTLVNSILYPVLANKLNGARIVPGKHRRVDGVSACDKVIHVDQNPIGRTPRSNPATYTGVWDKIRTLFAKTPEAQVRGYGPGRFSFNVKGGRCEACHGDGTLKIEMNFLPDVYVECEECHGKRYNRETLEVKYNGKTVSDVLDMPIEEAARFFKAYPSISRYLDTLTQVGLGYIRLGQPAPTLSGGESQRVKLATELQRRATGNTVYILDEPTTGLHFEDVRKLLIVLQGLVDKGNTVIVIEHNLDVVKSADWLIDLGPEGGDGGGTVVAEGTPEQVAQHKESWTGRFLAPMLKEGTRR